MNTLEHLQCFPGKIGRLEIISAKIQPTDHISTEKRTNREVKNRNIAIEGLLMQQTGVERANPYLIWYILYYSA